MLKAYLYAGNNRPLTTRDYECLSLEVIAFKLRKINCFVLRRMDILNEEVKKLPLLD